MKERIFNKHPIDIIDGIPIFSNINEEYIKNYGKISHDHLKAIKEGCENPFIDPKLWEEMENSTLELIVKYLGKFKQKKKIKILDVGVGLGRLLEKLINKVETSYELNLYGLDISLEYLKKAKEKGINVVLSKVEDIPFKKDFFDIIICTDVLEHVLDLNIAIKNILYTLSSGGILIVRVPNKEDLSSYLDKSCPYFYVHLRNFDRYSLELLFTRIFNLNILEFKYAGYAEVTHLLKYKMPIKGYKYFILGFGRFLKLINKNYYLSFLKFMFNPVEINCVLMKNE